MSKSVASESNEGQESGETSRNRGGEDEEKDNEEGIIELPPAEGLTISTVVSTVPATTDQFIYTPELMRHFVDFVPGDTLMTLRLATKEYNTAADVFIDEGVKSGEFIVHGAKDFSNDAAKARKERRKLVTRVFILLDITNVAQNACRYAHNLVVVDIPEGVESIGAFAFFSCHSLTTVSFPTTLTSIGEEAFRECFSLDNVDLLHTNLQGVDMYAFWDCSQLKSMTIPDSLQKFGDHVFVDCSNLVPSNINDEDIDAVVDHLRSKQQQAEAEK
ncbi:hypothetical protein TL16_g12439 [Triparma laevis f. inornata]|uniref:Leucine-rich repeat domain-containing protein n=2 Tax=Triparma laevis TaxID=1534972 RepID=A0A9W7EDT6_9STRA|nr:hypothetical protein TrLO_g13279 [Triparma laevis f. longispina]GMH92740.1 hypothetical protein TL16_g12439 [Triparma laevis f. inornata]